MALNWDKLSKLQREHSKPKFALNEISRQLKKRPTDPYLLAWQVENAFRLGTGKSAANTLDLLFGRQPPIVDARLLSYLYSLQVKRTVYYAASTQPPFSAGKVALAAWENAAKTFQSRSTRVDLWSELFVTAMQEECWEDVRVALVYAQKEGLKSSKNAVFAAILAGQLSYEMQKRIAEESDQPLSPQTTLQRDLSLARMKLTFQTAAKSPQDPVRVQDWADLQFMAQIFRDQSKHRELFELWDNAAAPLKAIIEVKSHDTLLLKLQILKGEEEWSAIQELCTSTVNRAIEESEKAESLRPLQDLSENIFTLWQTMLLAVERGREGEAYDPSAHDRAKEVIERFIAKAKGSQGRTNDLTLLYLGSFCGEPLLPRCKSYWTEHRRLPTCYKDLRPFIEQLSADEQKDFYSHITSTTASSQVSKNEPKKWLQDELSALEFGFLLAVSLPEAPEAHAVDKYIASVIRLCKISRGQNQEVYYAAGYLAMRTLPTRSGRIAREESTQGDVATAVEESRTAHQAAFLAQHLTSGKEGKENRGLLLYSVRLNILLGLASLAFAQYPDVRVKEMLNDTLSHHLLSRISQIHPFDTTVGTTKVNADQELDAVISKIEKLEDRVDGTLCTDIKEFKYGQALDLLGLKRKFRSSLTKHLCVVERRRIARLKGGMVDDSLDLDITTFVDIADNRDFGALFNPESTTHGNQASHKVSSMDPTISTLYQYYKEQDVASQLIFKETPHATAEKRVVMLGEAAKEDSHGRLPADRVLSAIWLTLGNLAHQLHAPDPTSEHFNPAKLPQTLVELLNQLTETHIVLKETSPQPNHTTPAASAFPRATTLISWYTHLEVLQATSKALDSLDEHLKKNPKSLPAKAKTEALATAKKLRAATDECYKNIRKDVQGWMDFLNKHGVAVLKGWARAGITGEALMELLSEDDVQFYARRAVESLMDSLGGILKVKIRR